jgi:hypothetical protein
MDCNVGYLIPSSQAPASPSLSTVEADTGSSAQSTASIFPTAGVNKIRYFFLFKGKRTVKGGQIHGYSQVTVRNDTAVRVKTAPKLEN